MRNEELGMEVEILTDFILLNEEQSMMALNQNKSEGFEPQFLIPNS
jgi:hypothetical protein